jgi:hypothetical protein
VSGKVHVPAALHPGKEPAVPIGWEARWAPEQVWTTWRRENSLSYWDLKSDPLIVQPVASVQTDCAIPAPLIIIIIIIIIIIDLSHIM